MRCSKVEFSGKSSKLFSPMTKKKSLNIQAKEFLPTSSITSTYSASLSNASPQIDVQGSDSKSIKLPNHPKHPIVPNSSVNYQSSSDVSNLFTCSICFEENNMEYYAVGVCNHPICCLCALRLRVKSRDNNCPICKTELRLMVVYSVRYHGKISNMKNVREGKKLNTSDQVKAEATQDQNDEMMKHPDFYSFGVSEEDLYLSPSPPGIQSDVSSGLLFYQCHTHYQNVMDFKAIVCPLGKCKQRFPSENQLIQHLNDFHNGLTLCPLCLTHRPLFIPEQILYTKKQLRRHMLGQSESIDIQPSNIENEYVNRNDFGHGGHPACEFCASHHYDKSALYTHMQSHHFTCHLCPSKFMFRYYETIHSLYNHFHSEHIVCNLCDTNPEIKEYGGSIAFKSYVEFTLHMKEFHGQINSVNITQYMTDGFRNGGTTSSRYVKAIDLDMGSANPIANDDQTTATAPKIEENFPQITTSSSHLPKSLRIPANMQVVGRITGTGRFKQLDKSDLKLKESLETAASSERLQLHQQNSKRPTTHDDFPTLSSSIPLTNDLLQPYHPLIDDFHSNVDSDLTKKHEPHPLSLVHQKKNKPKPTPVPPQDEDNPEQKRMERELKLMQSFYGVEVDESLPIVTNEEDSAIRTKLVHSIVNIVITKTEDMKHSEWNKNIVSWLMDRILDIPTNLEFFRVLYPNQLIAWGKNNRLELMKIEKKLQALLLDTKANSDQFKPMPPNQRHIIHCLARFYGFNSYEYDPEPRRYVSVVKTMQSSIPTTTLSRAIGIDSTVLIANVETPIIHLVLNKTQSIAVHNVNSQGAVAKKGQTSIVNPSRNALGVFTCVDVIIHVMLILLNHESESDAFPLHQLIRGIQSTGPSSIGLTFDNIDQASPVFHLLLSYSTTVKDNHTASNGSSFFFDFFTLIPSFTPMTQETVADNEIQDHFEELGTKPDYNEYTDSFFDDGEIVNPSHYESNEHDYVLIESNVNSYPQPNDLSTETVMISSHENNQKGNESDNYDKYFHRKMMNPQLDPSQIYHPPSQRGIASVIVESSEASIDEFKTVSHPIEDEKINQNRLVKKETKPNQSNLNVFQSLMIDEEDEDEEN